MGLESWSVSQQNCNLALAISQIALTGLLILYRSTRRRVLCDAASITIALCLLSWLSYEFCNFWLIFTFSSPRTQAALNDLRTLRLFLSTRSMSTATAGFSRISTLVLFYCWLKVAHVSNKHPWVLGASCLVCTAGTVVALSSIWTDCVFAPVSGIGYRDSDDSCVEHFWLWSGAEMSGALAELLAVVFCLPNVAHITPRASLCLGTGALQWAGVLALAIVFSAGDLDQGIQNYLQNIATHLSLLMVVFFDMLRSEQEDHSSTGRHWIRTIPMLNSSSGTPLWKSCPVEANDSDDTQPTNGYRGSTIPRARPAGLRGSVTDTGAFGQDLRNLDRRSFEHTPGTSRANSIADYTSMICETPSEAVANLAHLHQATRSISLGTNRRWSGGDLGSKSSSHGSVHSNGQVPRRYVLSDLPAMDRQYERARSEADGSTDWICARQLLGWQPSGSQEPRSQWSPNSSTRRYSGRLVLNSTLEESEQAKSGHDEADHSTARATEHENSAEKSSFEPAKFTSSDAFVMNSPDRLSYRSGTDQNNTESRLSRRYQVRTQHARTSRRSMSAPRNVRSSYLSRSGSSQLEIGSAAVRDNRLSMPDLPFSGDTVNKWRSRVLSPVPASEATASMESIFIDESSRR